MRPVTVVAGGVVVLLLVAGLTPVAVAEDDWADDCETDGFYKSSTGVYAGVVDGLGDRDVVQFELDRGDYVTVTTVVDPEHRSFRFDTTVATTRGRVEVRNVDAGPGVTIRESDESGGPGDAIRGVVRSGASGEDATWELHALEDSRVCIEIQETSATEFPYGWEVSLNENSQEPNPLAAHVVEQRLAERDRRIATLETVVEEQRELIIWLRDRVDEPIPGSPVDDSNATTDDGSNATASNETAVSPSDEPTTPG